MARAGVGRTAVRLDVAGAGAAPAVDFAQGVPSHVEGRRPPAPRGGYLGRRAQVAQDALDDRGLVDEGD